MKKLLLLTLPLLLASCNFTPANSGTTNNATTGGESGEQTSEQSSTHHGHNTNTGGKTDTETSGNDETETGGNTTGGNTSTTENEDVEIVFSNIKATSGSSNGVSFEAKKENANNPPAYNPNEFDLRIYAKGTFTVSSDVLITKIVFKISSQGLKRQPEVSVNTGSISYDLDNGKVIWTGSSKNIVFTAGEDSTYGSENKAGQFCFTSIIVTKGSGGSTTGGGTTGGGTTGGGTTGGGGDIQAGNGNTSHAFTSEWTGVEKDIAYSLFKGNLPHLNDFNKYCVGYYDGSTIPYFNPYIESNWSKESQTEYDFALKEMGYKLIKTEPFMDTDGNVYKDTPVMYYQKGTYFVQTSHYQSGKLWYFDVYAYNDYQAPFKLDYTPKAEFNCSSLSLKSGYQSVTKTVEGITFKANAVTKNSDCIQIDNDTAIEITGTSLSKMDLTALYQNKFEGVCIVYAGTSASNAKAVYSDGGHYELPAGTKYVKILASGDDLILEDICIL